MTQTPPDRERDFHLERFLPYLVHSIGSRIAEGFEDGFSAADISLQEWRALAVLDEFGPQTMGEIARRTSINASTMTRLVGAMEKSGLVKRERPIANQRVVYVRLLDGGREKVDFLIPRVIQYEQELIACFSEAELETFKSMLSKLFRSLTEDADTAPESDRLAG